MRLLFADLSSPSVPPPVLSRPYSKNVLIGFCLTSGTHARISKHFVILGNVEGLGLLDAQVVAGGCHTAVSK